jgi:uncharacterized protein (TIGR03067 family)
MTLLDIGSPSLARVFRSSPRTAPLYAGMIQVDESVMPAAIDFEHTEGGLKGNAWKGIYAQDGDTLTTCDNAPNLEKGRPSAFEAKSGSGYVLITFRRAKS